MSNTPRFNVDAFLDVDNASCASDALQKVAELVNKLAQGQILELRAIDVTVPVDLKAWCNLTHHRLIAHVDDRFLIQRQ